MTMADGFEIDWGPEGAPSWFRLRFEDCRWAQEGFPETHRGMLITLEDAHGSQSNILTMHGVEKLRDLCDEMLRQT